MAETAKTFHIAPFLVTDIIMAQDAVPAWFEPAMTTLLAPILAPIRITLAQTRNFHFLDGSIIPFMIVPFNDGSMPTEAPHNLPPLVNVAAVRALTEAQTTAYAVGYALGNVGPEQLDAQYL